jgi:hypothetical protein
MMRRWRWTWALLAGLACALGARTAAAVNCIDLPTPIFVTGSTAAQPLLAEVGKILAGQTPPVTVVYYPQSSCAGVDAILSGTPFYGISTGGPLYWDTTGAQFNCDVPSANPVVAQIGISDVFATTCYQLPGGLPTRVGEYIGPVQAMTLATHALSTEKAISAEAAYYVFGFGADSQVPPWTVEASIFKRDPLSGTQRMIATAIGVPPDRWKGTATTSSNDMVTRLATDNFPNLSIGILSAAVAQDNSSLVKVLAYQDFGQRCALFPDSSQGANDKLNVRNGLYPIWGPLHLFIRLDANGYPANARAGNVAGYIAGTLPAPSNLDLIKVSAQSRVVPQCAMRVKRAQEMGPPVPYAPSGACGCYYEKLATNTTSCKTCTTSSQCPASAPVCSYGYCEAQ